MEYEVIVHWKDEHGAIYEYRVGGTRIVLKPGAEKEAEVTGANLNVGPWSPFQVAWLQRLGLLVETDEPFVVPVPPPPPEYHPIPIEIAARGHILYPHYLVHRNFTEGLPWNLAEHLADLFDPDGFNFLTFPDTWMMAHVAHHVGAFPSVSDARRNGWNKPIPPGFSQHVMTKRRIHVVILNKYEGMRDWMCNYKYCRCGTGCGVPPTEWFPALPGGTSVCPFDAVSYLTKADPVVCDTA